MKTIKAFLNSHPLLSYFALTFAITWSLFVFAVGPGGIPATKEEFTTLPLLAILAVLVGPSVSGILLTGLLYGREGYRDLFARMRRWRVGARWYAVALLTAPLVFTVVHIPLSLISPVFLPGIFASEAKVSFVLMSIVVGLVVGIFEELGWTGFAVPTLLKLRYGVLSTGLVVGVLWGAWHLLGNDIWASVATSGGLPPALFAVGVGLVLLVGQLPAYRVLMVWVYERSGGSLRPSGLCLQQRGHRGPHGNQHRRLPRGGLGPGYRSQPQGCVAVHEARDSPHAEARRGFDRQQLLC